MWDQGAGINKVGQFVFINIKGLRRHIKNNKNKTYLKFYG